MIFSYAKVHLYIYVKNDQIVGPKKTTIMPGGVHPHVLSGLGVWCVEKPFNLYNSMDHYFICLRSKFQKVYVSIMLL
jgi:hypothetical protein